MPLDRIEHVQLAVPEGGEAAARAFYSDRRSWATISQVRLAVFDYIEVFFNRRRLHSSLDYLTPVEYEAKIHHHSAAQAA